MGMQNIETATHSVSQHLKSTEDVRPGMHPELLNRKALLLCLRFQRFRINSLLTNAGNYRFESQFYLLGYQVQQHNLGTVKAAAVYNMQDPH
jgi:hypothetical protein